MRRIPYALAILFGSFPMSNAIAGPVELPEGVKLDYEKVDVDVRARFGHDQVTFPYPVPPMTQNNSVHIVHTDILSGELNYARSMGLVGPTSVPAQCYPLGGEGCGISIPDPTFAQQGYPYAYSDLKISGFDDLNPLTSVANGTVVIHYSFSIYGPDNSAFVPVKINYALGAETSASDEGEVGPFIYSNSFISLARSNDPFQKIDEVYCSNDCSKSSSDNYEYMARVGTSYNILLFTSVYGINRWRYGPMSSQQDVSYEDLYASAFADPYIEIDNSSGNYSDYAIAFSEGVANVPLGAVPEPATWAMMLIGIGAIGGAMRRHPKSDITVSYS